MDEEDRPFIKQTYNALKFATERLYSKVGGALSASYGTRADCSQLSRYKNVNDKLFAPIDVIADLEHHAKEPFVTRLLADLSGFILVKKPKVECSPVWTERLGKSGKETGEAMAKLFEAFGDDGHITAAEIAAKNLDGEVLDALEALAEIHLVLIQIKNGEIDG